VHVEIWSDIACPWCYVGKRRFEAALAAFAHRDDVRVTWRSFELDPAAPRERAGDRAVHLAEKYGVSVEEARAMHDRMAQVAAGEGLDFRFESVRGANTFDAHRLLHLAAAHDRQDAVKERLMRAHFTEGELVSDPAVLERLAVEAGLPEGEVRDVLASERYAAEVRDDERTAAALGITAVPFFAVDRAIGVSGAHPAPVLVEALERGSAARPAVAMAADGETAAAGRTPSEASPVEARRCGVDGC